MAAVFLAIGWAAAYWVWPSGIIDLPLLQITLGTLFRVIASGAIAFAVFVMAAMLWF